MLDNSQKLSEMSNEELWALFPIVIREYNPDYPIWYTEEELALVELIGYNQIERISHIGSTAVPGLLSKPTVDILLEITQDCHIDNLIFRLEQNGYICSRQPENPAPHLMFMKGYTLQGFAEKVFHLHVRYGGDWDEIYFRDYLRLHPDISQQYGILKSELQQRFEHDRDGYTYAKTDFIKRYTKLAKSELGMNKNEVFENKLLCKGRLSVEHKYYINAGKASPFLLSNTKRKIIKPI